MQAREDLLKLNDAQAPREALSRVPTRQEIELLQAAMVRMPQCMDLRTEHYFVPGMYLRKLWRPAGTLIVGKIHKAPHFFLCASGHLIAWSETGMRHLREGDVIESQPGTKRVTLAMTHAVGITIHKTDLTDLDAIEAELIEPEEASRFDSANRLRDYLVDAGVLPQRFHIEGEPS